jgi:hypothetical protein
MSFTAKYAGRCNSADCRYGDNHVRVGDDADYHDDELMHAECAADARRGHGTCCPNCWQYHRGECA